MAPRWRKPWSTPVGPRRIDRKEPRALAHGFGYHARLVRPWLTGLGTTGGSSARRVWVPRAACPPDGFGCHGRVVRPTGLGATGGLSARAARMGADGELRVALAESDSGTTSAWRSR